jgi:hypothetical protein
MKLSNKKGSTILMENIVFILLNLAFLGIIILFILTKSNNAVILEELYAKEVALMLDSAKAATEIHLNMEDAFDVAEKEKFEGQILTISDNVVTVQLRENGGYSYSFFNDVRVSTIPNNIKKEYGFIITQNDA